MATTEPFGGDPASLVDLSRYPLLDPEGAVMASVLAAARGQMTEIGAAEFPGFLSSAGLAVGLADAEDLTSVAWRSEGYGTAYLGAPDTSQPEGHPRRYFDRAAVGVVAYDQFPAESPLRCLYEWEPLLGFVEAVLGRGPLHRYADPLGALNLAVMAEGDELQWHFDMTDFVVSLALRGSSSGGDFLVAPLVRSATDENYPGVQAVLEGRCEDVRQLPMTPGTLLVFEGRHSLHRVSRVGGPVSRLVALLGYDTRPGTCSSEELQLARYGRTSRP